MYDKNYSIFQKFMSLLHVLWKWHRFQTILSLFFFEYTKLNRRKKNIFVTSKLSSKVDYTHLTLLLTKCIIRKHTKFHRFTKKYILSRSIFSCRFSYILILLTILIHHSLLLLVPLRVWIGRKYALTPTSLNELKWLNRLRYIIALRGF